MDSLDLFYRTDLCCLQWRDEAHHEATLETLNAYFPVTLALDLPITVVSIDNIFWANDPVPPNRSVVIHTLRKKHSVFSIHFVGPDSNWALFDSFHCSPCNYKTDNFQCAKITLANVIKAVRRKRQNILTARLLVLLEQVIFLQHILFEPQLLSEFSAWFA